MRSSQTAPPEKSVWDVVGQDVFERNVAALRRQNIVLGAHVYTISNNWTNGGTVAEACDLQIDVERELADDFAFVAAHEEGVRTVTAAVIETSSSCVKVVLAANEGIDDRVECTFQDMFRLLEACARCGW